MAGKLARGGIDRRSRIQCEDSREQNKDQNASAVGIRLWTPWIA